ncbi:MAG: GNAT family N-acetyltransferase [Ruminococcus sp.]|nr:GNAT family N-acetyltransferase [Ruminococcus sp.]
MDHKIRDNILNADDFLRLFSAAGWGELPRDMAQTAIDNSYAVFSVVRGNETIAMARLLGDGAMAFFLKDLTVAPEYRGQGIGRALMTHIEEYIAARLQTGWNGYFQLVSAKGKEGFYSKLGYISHPNENSGAAMSKWIEASSLQLRKC